MKDVLDVLTDIIQEKNKLELRNHYLTKIIDKIDQYELKIFVDTNGRLVTNEFKQNMKELCDMFDD